MFKHLIDVTIEWCSIPLKGFGVSSDTSAPGWPYWRCTWETPRRGGPLTGDVPGHCPHSAYYPIPLQMVRLDRKGFYPTQSLGSVSLDDSSLHQRFRGRQRQSPNPVFNRLFDWDFALSALIPDDWNSEQLRPLLTGTWTKRHCRIDMITFESCVSWYIAMQTFQEIKEISTKHNYNNIMSVKQHNSVICTKRYVNNFPVMIFIHLCIYSLSATRTFCVSWLDKYISWDRNAPRTSAFSRALSPVAIYCAASRQTAIVKQMFSGY